MADLKKTGVKLVAEDARAFESDMGKATGAVQGFGKAANSLDMSEMNKSLASLNLQQTGETINNSLSRPLGQAALASIDTAATFEETLSGVAAVLSPTTEEMTKLEQIAIDLGGSTKFSAQESASAIEMLAKNGLSATEILGGALDATLSFAAATGADLPTSADIATDAMLAFGKEASDLPGIVDELTGVTVNSKFGWQDLSLALAQGGGVFAGVGGEIDDFSTALAAISPLFTSGSDAGTSLKVMMTRLIPASNDARDAMRELGLIGYDMNAVMQAVVASGGSVEDAMDWDMADTDMALRQSAEALGYVNDQGKVTGDTFTDFTNDFDVFNNAFFDAQGNLQDMTTISGELARATAGLSEEEKNRYLTTIFGQDAMRAAIALSQTGADGFTTMQSRIAEVDAGAQAATRMDNLKGSIEELRGALETTQIEMGQRFIPVVRRIVDIVTEGVRWFGQLPEPVQNASLAFGAVAVAAGPLLIALGAISGAIAAIPVAFATLAPLAPGFLALGSTVAGVAGAWVTDFGGIRTTTITTLNVLQSSFSGWGSQMQTLWTNTTSELSSAWDTAVGNVSTFLSEHQDEIDGVMKAIPRVVEKAWDTIERTITDVTGIVTGVIEGVTGLLSGDWDDAQSGAQKVVEGVWSQIEMRIETAWGIIKGILDTFGVDTTGLQTTIETFSEKASAAVTWLQSTVQSIFADMRNENTDLGNKVKELQDTWRLASETIINLVTPLWETIQSLFGEGQTFIETHGDEIDEFISTTWESIGSIISTAWDIIIEVIQGAITIIDATVVPAFEAIQSFVETHGDDIQKILSGAWEIIGSTITGTLSIIDDALTLVLAVLQGDWDTAWQAAGSIVETTWGTLGNIVNGALNIIDGAVGSILGLLGESWSATWNAAWNIVDDFLANFTSITFNTEPFRNAGNNLISSLQNGMQNAWDGLWGWLIGKFGFGGDGLASQISDFAGNWADAGRDLIDGIKNGMEDAWHRVTDWLRDKAQDLPEPIRDILGISSPSKVMAEETGAPAAEGVGVGFLEAWTPVEAQMRTILDGLVRKIAETGDIGVLFGQRLAEMIPYIRQVVDALMELSSAVGQVGMHYSRLTEETMAMRHKLTEEMTGLVEGTRNSLSDLQVIGAETIAGMRMGMEREWERTVVWLTEEAQRLPEPVRQVLQIGSPSEKMAQETGEPVAEGVGVGFMRALVPVQNEMTASLEGLGSKLAITTSAGATFGEQLATVAPALDRDTVAMQEFGAVLDQTAEKMMHMQHLSMAMGERMQEGLFPIMDGLTMLERRLQELPAMAAEVSMRVQEQAAQASQSTTNNYNLNVTSNAPMTSIRGEFSQQAALNR